MKIVSTLAVFALAAVTVVFAADEEDTPIKKAMRTAHKAPKTEKKLGEKIVEGTATAEEKQIVLALYKAMADTKPPRGDADAFRQKVARLIAATEEVVADKPDAAAHFKEAVNCKACHREHKPE